MARFPDNLVPSTPDGATTLQAERNQSNISKDELGRLLFSHDGFLERQARILPLVLKEKLFDKTQQLNLSRVERFKLALARGKLLRRLQDKYNWDLEDYRTAEYLVDDVSPYMLHLYMFANTVREQASEAQQAHWLPLIESWKIIGAYAQTELGHGSNVQGIEVTATWDQKTKEFVLHSPSLTASKWWNGSLGRLATHAIVMAQLLIPEPGSSSLKSHGPHPFIVQVRDMDTHQPLPGIVIGDIGPKYGYATMDNAYMLFDQFRIPHSALLDRYSTLDKHTGSFTKASEPAVVYGSLVHARVAIIQNASLALARAVTIGIRYTAVRRQFKDRDGAKGSTQVELQVLDYPTVQIRLFPLLASTFALHFTRLYVKQLYENTRGQISAGDFRGLAELHTISSGLKSYCTGLVSDGIEVCRRALGGHGYSGASGIVQLNNDYLSRPTVEGDNWMITQQVAAQGVKRMASAVESTDSVSHNSTESRLKTFLRKFKDPGVSPEYRITTQDAQIVKSFEHRADTMLYQLYVERVKEKRSWNSMTVKFHKFSQAQSQWIMVSTFFNALQSELLVSKETQQVLRDLYRLFALWIVENNRYEFLRYGGVSARELDNLDDRLLDLLARIRPHAVTLVDSWFIPDYLLDSALGRYDGKVYEDLFNRAHRLNPLNELTFNPYYWDEELVKNRPKESKL
ncbi:hypothetical protein BJX70DRAFT_399722 [Aspergillus crustosus]